jgi:predicted HicB family RNase H-like nuclease
VDGSSNGKKAATGCGIHQGVTACPSKKAATRLKLTKCVNSWRGTTRSIRMAEKRPNPKPRGPDRNVHKENAIQDRFDGYAVEMFLDDDGDYLAHFAEMPNVSAFGRTPEKALAELATAWELVKESYEEEKLPLPIAPSRREYKGVFNVRIDRRVHRALAIEAERAGLSLNALVAQKLARSVQE